MSLRKKIIAALLIFSSMFSIGGFLHVKTVDQIQNGENEQQYEGFQLDRNKQERPRFGPREYIRITPKED